MKHIWLLLIVGFVFRLFLAFHAYNPLVFDAKGYSDFAVAFVNGKFPIDCCAKNIGYSAFLAGIYALFGTENLVAVRIIQSMLDIGTALLIYFVAKNIFSEKAARFSFIIYLFNPFTAAFTGLVMAETLTFFLVLLTLYIVSQKSFHKNIRSLFLLGLLLGLLLFVRHSVYYFIFVFLVVMAIKYGIKFFAVALVGLLVASSYSLIMYYKTFKKISFVPPDNLTYEILYTNFSRWHYPEVEFKGIDPLYEQVIGGYWDMPPNKREAYGLKYRQLFYQRLPKEWQTYITNLGWNVIWLWDKDHLYVYVDQFYPADRWPLRILNIGLIALWCIGLVRYSREKRKNIFGEPIVLFSILLFCYITLLFPLLSNESRHTLVYYPLFSLWAGHGVSHLL